MIKKEELAEKLNGREYLAEITKEEEIQAKKNGLIVVFGYSDDNIELRGAWDDEIPAYGGISLRITAEGPIKNNCKNDNCPYFEKLFQSTTNYISAKWQKEEGYDWWIESNLPFAPFDIIENNDEYSDKFCRGIVIDIKKRII